jgi:hypothetical protein
MYRGDISDYGVHCHHARSMPEGVRVIIARTASIDRIRLVGRIASMPEGYWRLSRALTSACNTSEWISGVESKNLPLIVDCFPDVRHRQAARRASCASIPSCRMEVRV